MIRAAYAAQQIPREAAVAQMEQVRMRAQRDIQLAKRIDSKLAERGAEFEVAADNLSPGTRREIKVARAARSVGRSAARSRVATGESATRTKRRPDPTGADLASSSRGDQGRMAATQGDHATAKAARSEQLRPTASGPEEGDRKQPEVGSAAESIRTLAGSNADRRDAFAARVAATELAAASQFGLGE